jgi:conflict system pore-forming effector with SLATT domain/uncharacterized protein DUF4231
MIDTAWDEYRGWAARARALQSSLRRWKLASLLCAVAAALFGALALEMKGSAWDRGFALAAAVTAGLAPIVGREIFSSALEKKWLRARALAETIKSECFRVVAGIAPYDGAERIARFIDWRASVTAPAAAEGVTPLADPVPAAGDKRRPAAAMDAAWYIERRIRDQKGFFVARQASNERAARRLRWLNFGASAAAVGFAAVGAAGLGLTAWGGVFVTAAAAITALGLLERRNYLAAQYGAMAIAMGRIEEWHATANRTLADLVDRTEALLSAEHAAWAQTMAKFHSAPEAGRAA